MDLRCCGNFSQHMSMHPPRPNHENLLGKLDLYFSSKIKVDTDPCLNQYCAHSFQYVLWTLLAREWLFSKGAPIVLFNLCPTVHWKPLFTYSAMNVSVRVREYVWSAHSPPIQLKRHDNIQQRAPLENTVMQIASSDIFPALNKESSPKVSSSRTGEHDQHHRSWLPFSFFSFAIRYISWLTSQWILELWVESI